MTSKTGGPKQKRLLLHVGDLPPETITVLLANDFVPVKVDDLSRVRIVDPVISMSLDGATIDAAGAVALDTLIQFTGDGARSEFAKRLISIIRKKASA